MGVEFGGGSLPMMNKAQVQSPIQKPSKQKQQDKKPNPIQTIVSEKYHKCAGPDFSPPALCVGSFNLFYHIPRLPHMSIWAKKAHLV